MTSKSMYDGYVGLCKQAAKGTPIAPTTFLQLVEPAKFDEKQEVDIYPELGGGPYNASAHKKLHTVNPSIAMHVRPSSSAKLFHLFLGADAKSGAAIPYTHLLTPARPLLYLSLERGLKTDLDITRVQDCKVDKITITGKGGDKLKMAVDFMGIKPVDQAACATDTYETDRAFAFQDGAFNVFGTAAFARIDGFTLELANNCEGGSELQTTEVWPFDILEQKLTGKLSFEIIYDTADTYFKDIMRGGGTAVVETLDTDGFTADFTYGAAGTLREFMFVIPAGGLVNIDMTPLAPGPEPKTMKQTVVGEIIKVAGSELISITFQNADAADYDA